MIRICRHSPEVIRDRERNLIVYMRVIGVRDDQHPSSGGAEIRGSLALSATAETDLSRVQALTLG